MKRTIMINPTPAMVPTTGSCPLKFPRLCVPLLITLTDWFSNAVPEAFVADVAKDDKAIAPAPTRMPMKTNPKANCTPWPIRSPL